METGIAEKLFRKALIGTSEQVCAGLRELGRRLKPSTSTQTVLHGMLSFLQFVGSLHIELSELAARKWSIGSLVEVTEYQYRRPRP